MALHIQKTRQPSMSSLSRFSAASALRRGDLKISEPIPIPREGVDGLGPQVGFTSNGHARNALSDQPPTENTHQHQNGNGNRISEPSKTDSFAFIQQESPKFRDPDYAMAGNNNNFKASRSSATSTNDSSKHKRQPSTLKSVIRKIFGNKKRREQMLQEAEELQRSIQHRSVPPGFKSSETLRQTRSSSLPIHEITRSSALGSHDPNITYSPPRHDIAHDDPSLSQFPPHTVQRRATLPSLIFSNDEANLIASQIAMDRAEQTDAPREIHLDGLGLQQVMPNPKRRSRSASALREMAKQHRMSPIQWRRRSDEIRYWRMSAGMPVSSTEPPQSRPQTQHGEAMPQVNEPRDINGQSPPEESEGNTQNFDDGFDFGTLIGSMQQSDISLEQRVNTLEVKLIDLEYAIAKLQGHDIASLQPIVLEEKPTKSARNSTASLQVPEHMGNGTFLESAGNSPTVEDVGHTRLRPLSIDTVRPQTAVRQSLALSHAASTRTFSPLHHQATQQKAISHEHYEALLSLIDNEQAARRTLEQQMAQLQQEMKGLRSPSYAHIKTGSYPTPSPDSPERTRQLAHHRHFEDTDDDTDTDDGYLEAYTTPTEIMENGYRTDAVRAEGLPPMMPIIPSGMI